jgi:hypothetical protein
MRAGSVVAFITIIVTVTAAYLLTIWYAVGRLDRRMERLEERTSGLDVRLACLEATVVHVGDRLDEHQPV